MALSKSSKARCMDEAIKITTALASGSSSGAGIEVYLDKIYKKLCEIHEDIEK